MAAVPRASPAVFVGVTSLDVVHRVDEPPPWGRKSTSNGVELCAGGPAANAAVTCAALLGSATLITAIGSGQAAGVVLDDLAAQGVSVIDIADSSWRIPAASVLVAADGARSVVAPGATTSPLRLTDEALHAVSVCRALLVDGHHPLAAEAALAACPEDAVTVLDAGSVKTHVEAWLPRLDVVAASADYAAGLGLDVPATIDHLLRAGVGAALVTTGPGPVTWRTAYGLDPDAPEAMEGTVIPPRVTAVDTLGAGDAFHGGLVAGLVSRGFPEGFEYAVGLAVETASLRVRYAGARDWMTHLTRTS